MKSRKSIIQSNTCCLICGDPNTELHHCVFGNANRKLADEDGLTVYLCPDHHRESMAESVHMNPAISKWSRVVGELAWINEYCPEMSREQAIAQFRNRYGKNYL